MRAATPVVAGVRTALALLLLLLVAGPAGAQAPDWPAERPPRPLPAAKVTFPPYEVRTLANGLQIVSVAHHEQPAVSLRLLVRAGAANDPADKPGVATLVAALLDQGTTTRSAQEIADTIDYIGGHLSTGATSDLSYASAIVMKDSFQLGMELLADVVRHPAFAPEEIERQRQQLQSSLRVSYEDPDYVAGVVFDRLVYGFHPYGRPQTGTPESIPAITRDDLVAFHRDHFAPNNTILAIVGDAAPAEAFAMAEKIFGDWESREVDVPPFAEPPAPTRRVVIVDRPGAVQTEIRVGHLGVPRKHPDYMALDMALRILGGEGSNRLHRVLRSDRGLTYSASADMNARKAGGDFVAETDTRSEATAEALRLTIEEFWRLKKTRVHPRELQDAQAYRSGSFPLTIETPDAIAAQILNALFHGLDLKDLETFRERVNAVTVDDVARVARDYLLPDRLSIVLVGDASTFEADLERLGFDQVERVSLADLDLTAFDLRRPEIPAGPGGSNGSAVPEAAAGQAPRARSGAAAQALVDRAIDAKGGLARLRSVRTISASGVTTIFTPEGPVRATTVTYIAYPDRFRVEASTPDGRLVQVYADGQAWIDGPQGVQEAPPALREDFQASAGRDLILVLRRAAAGELEVRPAPPLASANRALDGVRVSGPGLDPLDLYLDPGTGLVRQAVYERRTPDGPERIEEVFSEYQPVDGLQVAHRAVVRRNGDAALERTVTDIAINPPLDGTLFQKPS